MLADKVIDGLGGPTAVARLFEPPISHAAVSQWRRSGIPAARLQLLRLMHPDVFAASGAHVVNIEAERARRNPTYGGDGDAAA